jgi:two-component system chemotaxis response regulator CheB
MISEMQLRDSSKDSFHVVAIGASAGGVEALCGLLGNFPRDLPAIVIIVLHRSIRLPSHLKEVLSSHAAIPVEIAREGQLLRSGVCYIGEPASHLTVTSDFRARLIPDGFYRAHNIDILFNSVARHAKSLAIGVVLSGMLKDGTEGLIAIKESGGMALVQTPEETTHAGMAESAMASGAVDFVGSIDELAKRICELTGIPFTAKAAGERGQREFQLQETR